MEKSEAAYLAGLLDGEGCLSVNGARCGRPAIEICMTTPAPLRSGTYIDVNPAEVRVGDDVKVDGYGMLESGYAVLLSGQSWERLIGIGPDADVTVKDAWLRAIATRRSSIVAARRWVVVVPVKCMKNTSGFWCCSLWQDHAGDHIAYKEHKIGGYELGRATTPQKADIRKCADS